MSDESGKTHPLASKIEGVSVIPLRRIPDERGTIMHMLKASDPHFIQFGEIYFSSIYKDAVKGWHRHREMTLNYACVHGRIKLVIYDSRETSRTQGNVLELFLGPDDEMERPPQVLTEKYRATLDRRQAIIGTMFIGPESGGYISPDAPLLPLDGAYPFPPTPGGGNGGAYSGPGG